MAVNGKISTWSVVVLVVSLMFFSAGLIFGIMKESTAKELVNIRIDIRTTQARLDIVEREYAVFANELRHINEKLDAISKDIQSHMEYTE
jgi:hypothetical protein